uniref:Uncharacterized protein n=1 Tax=Timema genevievae TaxID=629358 RepID=A0A7R9JYN7_TIMGE|nr:unnamed protein product [Timema genevievae]
MAKFNPKKQRASRPRKRNKKAKSIKNRYKLKTMKDLIYDVSRPNKMRMTTLSSLRVQANCSTWEDKVGDRQVIDTQEQWGSSGRHE